MYLKKTIITSTESYSEKIDKMKACINDADAVVIGAGAGLSTSAGLSYSGKRFEALFPEYIEKYNLPDMYSAAFYPHKTEEELWGYWCKHIYHNRYAAEVNDTYKNLMKLVCDKNYFVITTNCDHLFRLHDFPKEKLFYTQGNYGLFQCSKACHNKTYDNKETVMKMIKQLDDLKIPSELVPRCPRCGEPMTMNLRKDGYFVEDDGWHAAMKRYSDFIQANKNEKIVYLELGVGFNTPSIIKYPFWQMTYNNKNATFISINIDEAICAKEIIDQSICVTDDIGEAICDCICE